MARKTKQYNDVKVSETKVNGLYVAMLYKKKKSRFGASLRFPKTSDEIETNIFSLHLATAQYIH